MIMISFGEVSIDDAERILKWRTSSRVTKFMNTDVEFNLDNQRQWLRSCYEKEHYYHWIIKVEGKPAGLLNICDYDPVNKTSSWGFYIGEDDSVGYGAFIPPMLYNFLFGEVGVEKIEVEVFYNNLSVIGLHQLHGYRFSPNKDRVILKNGRQVLLIAMTLSSLDWANNKRFRNQISEFPTSLWLAKPNSLRDFNKK
jgi:UDP-4-amino-4,6-dideoxy-N-acetyl-beta-L-altrosamine N-acetyltransferase